MKPIGPERKCTIDKIDVAHVVRRIVVLDESSGPVIGLDDEIITGIDPRYDRNIEMPAIVAGTGAGGPVVLAATKPM